ncbi:GT-D fold domain-containing glycosyltransferase [Marinicrinis lubricantis]|uniref:GT-D fold domain-containing glycosyltransferase n=1 Tax=Marinicrinis lubricantis TaxID=2086470 RepID=A0ABW1IUS1_9BACL
MKKRAKLKNPLVRRWQRRLRLNFNRGYNQGYDDGYTKGVYEGQQGVFDLGFDRGYNQGFDYGHEKGFITGMASTESYKAGYEKGWEMGAYEGGEQWIEKVLPQNMILPGISLEQIASAGVQQYQHAWLKLLEAREVAERFKQALDQKTPFSVVRLGDGELLTLAQDRVLSIEEIKRLGHFLPYAGIQIPDYHSRDQLLTSVLRANVVGIPDKRLPSFQPLAFKVFQAYAVPYRLMALTNSLINYQLYEHGLLHDIWRGRKVICIGNLASSLAKALSSHECQVTGMIDHVNGMKDAERVIVEAGGMDFDIALVSAGVAAVVICEQIAARYGKAALDFGHLADRLIQEKQD